MSKLAFFFVLVTSITAAVCAVGWIVMRIMRKAKYRSARAAGVFLALHFFGLTDTPPPTPQEQAEQQNRTKKNRGASDKA